MSEWDPGTRRVDAVILTVSRPEFDAVLKVEAGAVQGSIWEEVPGPTGLPVAFRQFLAKTERPLRVAVAGAPDMGATAALHTLIPLVERLEPICIAMCGVCTGRRGKVQLGDVVAADRLYYHDTGRQLPGQVEWDLTTYKLRDDWKAALEGMDAMAHFREEPWFQARPVTTEWQEYRALLALRDGAPEPWKAVASDLGSEQWQSIVAALRERGLLAVSGRELTGEGRRFVDDLLFQHKDALPDISPAGTLAPFRMHVAPIGSGARDIEDETIWGVISHAMRKTLALEKEAAALGELAHRQRRRPYLLDAVVMKGVEGFGEPGRDGQFHYFAARASAECLLWFLREQVSTELAAGFDDLLTSGTLPLPDRVPAPSLLLNARHAVVPWHETGRSEILAELDAWVDDPSRPVALRLLHAQGGVGKTRLAIEWVRRRRERRDVAGFLVPAPDSRWLERLCGLGPPVIAIIDYAENRADLITVLQRVAAFASDTGPRRRVRIVLLARGDGDWWEALRQARPEIAALEDRAPHHLRPLADTGTDREAVFIEASKELAARRHRLLPLGPRPTLDDVRFERVLYVHMAALAVVEAAPAETLLAAAAQASAVTFDPGSLMSAILQHEERFWVREATDRSGIEVDLPLARQLIAAATLRGGLTTRDQAREMCERLEKRPRTREDDALLALLHNIYESDDRASYLPGLEPDLLGEAMVLRVAAPPGGAGVQVGDDWIERVFVAGDDADALATAFTVLGRASATNSAAVQPWLTKLLQGELPRRAVLALRAGKAVGQHTAAATVGDLLAETLEQRGSISIALELAQEAIPYPTVSLMRVAEWELRVRLAHAAAEHNDQDLAARAALLREHGLRLFELGRRESALAATSQAVDIDRALAERDRALQSNLAESLNYLGIILRELGQHKQALMVSSEAVALYQMLTTRDPDAFQSRLAGSLTNLANILGESGQQEPALTASREAVDLYRTLVTRNADAFLPLLGKSLTNLSAWLSKLGQQEPALAAVREGVDLYRTLAMANPDAFQVDLAGSLRTLGVILMELGQHDSALAVTREAMDLNRAFALRNPDAFESQLADSLANLSISLRELGQPEQALVIVREAVDLHRKLATRNPDAFQHHLATSLNSLGITLSELGQREAAHTATQEALALYRRLSLGNPDAFKLGLAMSLSNMCKCLSEVGQRDAALAAAREAVDIYRVLAERNPDAFQPNLALGLINLGMMLNEHGQGEPALAAIHEAVNLYRTLAKYNPGAFRSRLATALINRGISFRALGQSESALVSTREAVALYRTLAASHPDAFNPPLARSLMNLGNMLSESGHDEAGLAAGSEAVQLYRTLAARHPEAFQADLAMSLSNLGLSMSGLRQLSPALAAIGEAVALYRTLAVRHPDTFQPQLARTLHDMGSVLSTLRQRESAVAALREAVELYRTLATRDLDTVTFNAALARSLNDLGLNLGGLGQHESALDAAREAVALCRTLSTSNPDAFQPYLVKTLNTLSFILNALGQRELANAALAEAAEIRRSL